MSGRPICELIDEAMRAPKTLAGNPDWHEVGHRGEHRLVMPTLIHGVHSQIDLEINAYPNIRDLRFRIMLRVPQCIWRLDYVDDERHVNPMDCWSECGEAFVEPHYHSWADNRRFCKPATVPDPLPVARVMPQNHRQFDNALRWFFGETNIAQPPANMIELPVRNRLV